MRIVLSLLLILLLVFKKINHDIEITEATDALICGTIIRAYKILDATTNFCCEHRTEIVSMLWRMLLESCAMVSHYTDVSPENRKKYLIASYREVRGRYYDLKDKEGKRALSDIESRMLDTMIKSIKFDSLEVKDILNKRVKDVKVEDLIKKYYSDEAYTHSYIAACSSVHGKWQDIRNYYLDIKNDRFFMKVRDMSPDPRYIMPHTITYLDALIRFILWIKIDDKSRNIKILEDLQVICLDIETKHETEYSEGYKTKYMKKSYE